MTVRRAALALAGAAALLGACQTPRSQLKAELGQRSSRELQCPEDQLRFDENDRFFAATGVTVTGCGRSMRFVMVGSRWTRAKEERR